ncbi:hypothetical protein CHF27_002645 [Romboutsia maritimum]|uniref:Uncharacterized protein n=1 Tax=Romboutsia maritimum TaxID=2020948 RepID=A0A371IVR0_9FIRM|nr:hypothetical protein [Romboutsia maritimum]RDY24558.1 hypothetical protein CHF27_002645 [Romboutsia maritimum]
MLSVIKAEIKKNFKVGVIIVWLLGMFLSSASIYTFNINDAYADLFFKYFGMAPIMGLAMFMMFSGSFILEYTSNMDGLIKATKNGKKQLVISKFIAAGISASIINLSMFYVMAYKVFSTFKFEKLDMLLKNLWYFGNSNSNITVLQMVIIMTLTVILGSFLIASVGLFLSSISKNAIVPFLAGGVLMGVPYMMEMRGAMNGLVVNIPLFGMYSSTLVRYNAPISAWIAFLIISIVGIIALYMLAKKSFLKEK